jgi:hypothetical protein
MVILWHTADMDQPWDVQVKNPSDKRWSGPIAPYPREWRFAVSSRTAYFVCASKASRGARNSIIPCCAKENRALKREHGRARPKTSQTASSSLATAAQARRNRAKSHFRLIRPSRISSSSPAISCIAWDASRNTGPKYFPVYNAPTASPETGAPLIRIRSTLFVSASGNHDIARPDLTEYPDSLAYFMYWSQRLNGPRMEIGNPNTPALEAAIEKENNAFLLRSGYLPRMANFSFDYGNAHWTVLDSNPNVNWKDPAISDWVAKDLASTKSATWPSRLQFIESPFQPTRDAPALAHLRSRQCGHRV